MTKDSKPKRHHYLPQFYLRGFSDKGFGDKKGRVRTVDLIGKKCFTANPKDVANIADYNTIQIPGGGESVVVEGEILSAIDSHGARIIGAIENTLDLPTGEDWLRLCIFIASLFVRVPRFRQANHEFAQHTVDLLATGLEAPRDDARRTKIPNPSGGRITFDDLKYLVTNENMDVAIPRTENVVSMLKQIPLLAGIGYQMTPYLSVASGEAQFITCDVPVHLFDSNDERRKCGLEGVGSAAPEVQITVPLTKNCCLILAWGDQLLPPKTPANDAVVANCNVLRLSSSLRYVFASSANFPFLYQDKICWGETEAVKLLAGAKSGYAIDFVSGGGIPRRPPKQVRR